MFFNDSRMDDVSAMHLSPSTGFRLMSCMFYTLLLLCARRLVRSCNMTVIVSYVLGSLIIVIYIGIVITTSNNLEDGYFYATIKKM